MFLSVDLYCRSRRGSRTHIYLPSGPGYPSQGGASRHIRKTRFSYDDSPEELAYRLGVPVDVELATDKAGVVAEVVALQVLERCHQYCHPSLFVVVSNSRSVAPVG